MKLFLDLFWNFDLLLNNQDAKGKNWYFVTIGILGLTFVTYVFTYPYYLDSLRNVENHARTKELIVASLYGIIILSGAIYNYRNLNFNYFKAMIMAFLIALGRTVLLILVELLLIFFIKFIAILIFEIPPMSITKFDNYFDIIWYYPLIQLPFFFYQYKKTS